MGATKGHKTLDRGASAKILPPCLAQGLLDIAIGSRWSFVCWPRPRARGCQYSPTCWKPGVRIGR